MRNILSAIAGLLIVIASINAIGLGVIAGNVKNLEERVREEVQKREGLEAVLQRSNVQHKLAYVKLSAKVDKMQANKPPCDLSGFVFKPEGIR